jgi:hypothetical protein
MGKFEQDDTEFLIDLLLETSLSIPDIAKELDIQIVDVKKKIDQLGLGWIKDSKKKMSRGQSALTAIMQKILVGEKIVNEYTIVDNLRLDVYCPKYKIAAEYHGRQHFFYTKRFFDSKYEFEQAQIRDEKKLQFCKDNGIALIVFRYNDTLTEDIVFNRMLEVIRKTDYIPDVKPKKANTTSTYYQEMKKKNSQYRKKIYRKMKDSKSNDPR